MRGRRGLAALVCAAAMLAATGPAWALDDGLALTPPMGFNDWNAFGCNVSEQLIEQTAAAMHHQRHAGGRLRLRQHRRLLADASHATPTAISSRTR